RRERFLVHEIKFCEAPLRLVVRTPNVELPGVKPNQRTNSAEQYEHGDDRPHKDSGRWRVANQWLMWPIAGVGDLLSRAIGRCCPGGPKIECVQSVRVRVTQSSIDGKGIILA